MGSQDNSQTTPVAAPQVVAPVVETTQGEPTQVVSPVAVEENSQTTPVAAPQAVAPVVETTQVAAPQSCEVVVSNTEMHPICCGLCLDGPDGTQFFPCGKKQFPSTAVATAGPGR